MTVTIPGYSSLTGKPATILQLMRDAQILNPEMSTADCIEAIQERAWNFFNIRLVAKGKTDEERAESLLRSLEKNNMIIIEEEE